MSRQRRSRGQAWSTLRPRSGVGWALVTVGVASGPRAAAVPHQTHSQPPVTSTVAPRSHVGNDHPRLHSAFGATIVLILLGYAGSSSPNTLQRCAGSAAQIARKTRRWSSWPKTWLCCVPNEEGARRFIVSRRREVGIIDFGRRCPQARRPDEQAFLRTADKGFGKGAVIGGVGAAVGILAGPVGWQRRRRAVGGSPQSEGCGLGRAAPRRRHPPALRYYGRGGRAPLAGKSSTCRAGGMSPRR
jgi:hypothetical protein